MNIKYRYFLFFFLFTFLYAQEVVLPTHAIHFVGQKHFDTAELEEALGVDNKSFFQFWKKDNPSIKDSLLPTLDESVKSFYRSEGFYDIEDRIEESNTTVTVYITENEPVRVKDIEIQSDYNISSFIKMKKNDIFRAKAFISSKNKIIKSLLNDGYCSYDLDTKAYVDLKKHTVDLVYHLSKGGVCRFGKLTLKGLKSIEDDVVISRVSALEGKRFSTSLVQETSNNLYALKAFDSILINIDRKFYNVIPVDIRFEEVSKPYHFEVGAGYDTYVGPRFHTEITKYNAYGNAKQLGLKLSWSKKEQLLILNYFKPALLSLYDYHFDFGAKAGYSNLELDGFREKKGFARTYLAYKDSILKLKVGMAIENIDIGAFETLSDEAVLTQAVNAGLFLLAYPYIDVVYDARDSKLNPKEGYYLAAYGEFGLSREEDSTVYMKTKFEARFIHTFSDLTLAVVGKIGVVDDESDKGLPESKYFFAGGAYSNRAYGYREIGVINSTINDTIYGASSMANVSFEADYPIWGDLYGAVFTDNTILTNQAYNFKGQIISSAGVGVRYMTPIGPFKLDVGFNVRKPSINGISFQIGQSF